MNFNIGDKVRINRIGSVSDGLTGEVIDTMYSNTSREYIYRVRVDGFSSRIENVTEEALELLKEDSVTYHFETDIAEDNVVIVIMYECTENSKTEIGRGHGHIIHEGAFGIAQATSYAMYRLYKRFEEKNL